MTRTPVSTVHVVAGLAVLAAWLVVAPSSPGHAQMPRATPHKAGGHGHGHHGHHHDHEHPPIPAAYAAVKIPPGIWTDPQALAKGKEIYAAKCALCHGERGDGKGPGAANLPLKPADLTDAGMVAEMPGEYWFWRVSEGGLVEPFKSKGSAMPAWKAELSPGDRWAVIAYAHGLSGHRGPHDASEHAELRPKPRYVTGDGTVIALRPDKQQLVLEHGEIKGFMQAMTMGYKIQPPALLERVKPGDKVRFTIDTQARAITRIEKVAD